MSSSPVETIMSDYPFEFISGSVTRVFWDVVDFPFPDGVDPDLIYPKMKSILEMLGCGGEVSIMAYVDKKNFGDDDEFDAYKKAGITIIPRLAGGRSMLPDIAWWEVDMRDTKYELNTTISLMVISSKKIEKESVFLTFLETLSCDNVILALPQSQYSPPTDLTAVTFEWLSTSFLDEEVKPFDHQQDRKRMRREESPYYSLSLPDSPVETIMPDCPVETIMPVEYVVFWDIMEFPFVDPEMIYYNFQNYLGFYGKVSIMAYVDTENFGDELLHSYKKAGITIIPAQADKYARAHSMSVDIVLWAMDHPATYFEPRALLVFSENVEEGSDFFNALEALKDRYYHVVVALPQHVSEGAYVPFFQPIERPLSKEEALGFSVGLAPLYEQDFHMSQIEVFWNVQGVPTDISSIGPALRRRGYRGPAKIRHYVNMDYQDPRLVDNEYTTTTRVETNCCDKYATITRILLDILFWAMNYDNLPQNLMLISEASKDTRCDIVIQALERRDFNVIFRPSESIDSFLSLSHETQLKHWYPACKEVALQPVALFWLVDDFPTNPMKYWVEFTSTLIDKGFFGEVVSMNAYIDKEKCSEELINAFRKAGTLVRLVPEKEEVGKITCLTLDLIEWTEFCFGSPFTFVVISKPFTDALFDSVAEPLKRRGFNVRFALPDYMVTFGSSLWSAKSLSQPLKQQ